MNSQVLRSVVESRFLTCADLGRLLLLTSKKVVVDDLHGPPIVLANDDDNDDNAIAVQHSAADCAYYYICMAHWQNVETVEMLKGVTKMSSWRGLFFAMALGRPLKQQQVVYPPLKYSPEDYTLLLQGRNDEGKLLFCEAVQGKDCPHFFTKGTCFTRQLSKPFAMESLVSVGMEEFRSMSEFLDSLDCDIISQGICELPMGSRAFFGWRQQIHLVRYESDGTCRVLLLGTVSEQMVFLDHFRRFEAGNVSNSDTALSCLDLSNAGERDCHNHDSCKPSGENSFWKWSLLCSARLAWKTQTQIQRIVAW